MLIRDEVIVVTLQGGCHHSVTSQGAYLVVIVTYIYLSSPRLLEKDPERRITVSEMRHHPWVTRGGAEPLTPAEQDNCKVQIQVTEEDIRDVVRSIPHLDTLILIKAM